MDEYEGDPESPASLHKYLYVQDNPISFADRSGRQIDDVMAALAIGSAIGATIGSGLGYLATGTARGAAFGAIGGGATGLALMTGNPALITQVLAGGLMDVAAQAVVTIVGMFIRNNLTIAFPIRRH